MFSLFISVTKLYLNFTLSNNKATEDVFAIKLTTV